MNIVVCLKYINSTEEYREKLLPFSPCDRNALGMALAIKKEWENITVSVVSMGPNQASRSLQDLYSYGVDEVYLISDKCFAGSDTLATTYVLASAIEKINQLQPIELILCGKNTIDSNTGQVGPGLAYRLNTEYYDLLQKIHKTEEGNVYETERYFVSNPESRVLATVNVECCIPFPTIHNIQLAKNKNIVLWNNKDLGLDTNRVGLSGSPTKLVKADTKYPSSIKKTFIEGNLQVKLSFLQEIIDSKGCCEANG